MNSLGDSFSPLQDGNPRTRQPGTASHPVQDAIRVLSLQVPRVVGARSIAPQPLLGGGAAGGGAPSPTPAPMGTDAAPNMGGGGIEDILRKLFGMMQGGAQGGPPSGIQPGGLSPSPVFTPGLVAGEPPPGSFHPGPVDLGDLRYPTTGPSGPMEKQSAPEKKFNVGDEYKTAQY